MKSLAPWAIGAILAFLVTSGAFLLLANLGTEPSEVRLEQRQPAPKSNSPLELGLDEERLASLEAEEDQGVTLSVRNGGAESLSDVNLTVEVYSEDTSLSEAERYRKTVEEITPGESAEVPFELDLSPPDTKETTDYHLGPEPPRAIIEIRATVPDGGGSAIRTVIAQP